MTEPREQLALGEWRPVEGYGGTWTVCDDQGVVAEIFPLCPHPKECAYRMAAAPDALKVCEDLVAWWESRDNPVGCYEMPLVAAAHAVLKKAELKEEPK